jgi:hypothetical protein
VRRKLEHAAAGALTGSTARLVAFTLDLGIAGGAYFLARLTGRGRSRVDP